MPSSKYMLSGSRLRFSKGSTAIDFSGSDREALLERSRARVVHHHPMPIITNSRTPMIAAAHARAAGFDFAATAGLPTAGARSSDGGPRRYTSIGPELVFN